MPMVLEEYNYSAYDINDGDNGNGNGTRRYNMIYGVNHRQFV